MTKVALITGVTGQDGVSELYGQMQGTPQDEATPFYARSSYARAHESSEPVLSPNSTLGGV